MNRQNQYEHHRTYIESEGLDRLLNFEENKDYKIGVFDAMSGKLGIPIPPKVDDLVCLHKLIRRRRFFTVFEFCLGYSTIVIADIANHG